MTQSEKFDDILNECLERILHGEAAEQCLDRFPQHADKLKPLLQTGSQVKQAVSVQPRPEFRANARLQFQAALNALPEKQQRSFVDWFKRPQMATVTAFALLIVLGTATGAMANVSMPDQPLYPVKLAMERAQISLTPSAAGKGQLYARILEKRMAEITTMANEGKLDKIQSVAIQLDSFAAGINVPADARKEGNAVDNAMQDAAPAFAPPRVSEATPPTSPGIAVAGPQEAIVITAAERNATPAMGAVDTAIAPAGISPQAALPALNQAATELVRLRALLETIPESSRPALQDAVNAVERTYQAVLAYLNNN